MYQKCPVCKGNGRIVNSNNDVCPTCNGTRIISTLTGLPPDFEKNKLELERLEALGIIKKQHAAINGWDRPLITLK